MKTVTIQIGNTDNKLTQQEWSAFVGAVSDMISLIAGTVHFKGGPPTWESWQNCALVFTLHESQFPALKNQLVNIRQKYRQDSIAWTEGETQFL